MSELFYSMVVDDEFYPYWVGVGGTSSVRSSSPEEKWCEHFAQRGYDFCHIHDSFNGNHMLFKFISKIDSIRFILSHPLMTDKRLR